MHPLRTVEVQSVYEDRDDGVFLFSDLKPNKHVYQVCG